MAGLLGDDEENPFGLLGSIGLGILANNQPGVSFGQAVGRGGLMGLQAQAQQQRVGVANQQMKMMKQLRDAQVAKMQQDAALRQDWRQMFSPAGAPGASPGTPVPTPGAVPDAIPGATGGAIPGKSPIAGIPPEMLPYIGMMGPEAGSKFVGDYLASRTPKEQWKPEVRGGVPGQVDALTGKWAPLDPTMTKVNVGLNMPPMQTKEQEKVGEYYGTTFTTLQSDAMKAQSQNSRLDALGNLLEKTYTGTGGETVQQLKRAAKAAGFDVEGVGEGDAAKAISGQMALELRNPAGGAGMPGALSNADRDFLQSMVPGLSQTPEGRKLLIDVYKRINQRSIDVAKMAREYRKKNGMINEGFFDELQAYSEKNSLFEGLSVPKANAPPALPPGFVPVQ